MSYNRHSSAYGSDFKRKQFVQRALLIAIILVLVSFIPFVYIKLKGRNNNDRRELRESFETGAYEAAYTQSRELLREKPLDFFLLSINGFSAYQLAIAQINNFDTLSYIDDSIWSLRKALLFNESKSDGRIYYVLGKAYYYKGPGYSDLAVKYLEKSRAVSYRAGDIPEYLGLAYAAIGDYRHSVAAFSLALTEDSGITSDKAPSDILLISIARSYIALGEFDPAKAYLIRCLDTTRDSRTLATAGLLLGNILVKNGDLSGAEAEYAKVIEKNDENAEAHYQLGELYALGGDTTRARAEWRRAFRIDPTFEPARTRLNTQ